MSHRVDAIEKQRRIVCDPNGTSRYWCFTLNNPTIIDEKKLQTIAKVEKGNLIQHLIYSKEKGLENNTLHLQGAILLPLEKRRTRLKTLKNRIGINTLHLERGWGQDKNGNFKPDKASYKKLVNYCIELKTNEEKSNGKEVWEYPNNYYSNLSKQIKPTKQTKRQILELAYKGELTKINNIDRAIYHDEIIKIYGRGIKFQNLYYRQKNCNYSYTFNLLLTGKTSVGKTIRIFQHVIKNINRFFELYWCPEHNIPFVPLEFYRKQRLKYWDDYKFQEIVWIEEVDRNFFKNNTSRLKEWLDGEPFPCEVKHGNLPTIRPLFTLMTSNKTLEDLCGINEEDYDPEELYKPLKERILIVNVESFDQYIKFPDYNLLWKYFSTINEVRIEMDKLSENQFVKLSNEEDFKKTLEEFRKNKQKETTEPPSERECDTEQENEPILLDSEDEGRLRNISNKNNTSSYKQNMEPCTKKRKIN